MNSIVPNIRRGGYFAVADSCREWYDLGTDEILALLHEMKGQANLSDLGKRGPLLLT